MEERVREVLAEAFPGIDVTTEVIPGGRVIGSVVWKGFEEYDDVDRQTMIRSVLSEKLGGDARQVGVLLAYTPAELEAMRAA